MDNKSEQRVIKFYEEIKDGFSDCSVIEKIAAAEISGDNKMIIKLIRDSSYRLYLVVQNTGEDLIVPCFDINEARDYIKKLQLNIEYLRTMKKKTGLMFPFSIDTKGGKEEEVVIDYSKAVKGQPDGLKTKYKMVDFENIKFNKMDMLSTRSAAKTLITHSLVSKNGDVYADFINAEYPDTIQNYLLEMLVGVKLDLPKDVREAIIQYKGIKFDNFNNFMRGNFESLMYLYRKGELGKDIKDILAIKKAFSLLPPRLLNIRIRRKGAGVKKSLEEGSDFSYDSFTSFATNNGSDKASSIKGDINYNMILGKEEPALPLDLIAPGILASYGFSECELLLEPAEYQVLKREEKEQFMFKVVNVDIKKKNKLDIHEILNRRLDELEELYKERQKQLLRLKRNIIFKNQSLKDKGYNPSILSQQFDLQQIFNRMLASREITRLILDDEEVRTSPIQYQSSLHGANHTRRVLFWIYVLAELDDLSSEEKKILITAAKYHDIGRTNDDEDKDHGLYSVLKLHSIHGGDLLHSFSPEEVRVIDFIIGNHSLSSGENERNIANLPQEKQAFYRKMLYYLKDADKLDRVRLGKYDGLDPKRLSLYTSHFLVKAAYQAESYLFDLYKLRDLPRVNEMLREIRHAHHIVDSDKQFDYPRDYLVTEPIKYFDDEDTKKNKTKEFVKTLKSKFNFGRND